MTRFCLILLLIVQSVNAELPTDVAQAQNEMDRDFAEFKKRVHFKATYHYSSYVNAKLDEQAKRLLITPLAKPVLVDFTALYTRFNDQGRLEYVPGKVDLRMKGSLFTKPAAVYANLRDALIYYGDTKTYFLDSAHNVESIVFSPDIQYLDPSVIYRQVLCGDPDRSALPRGPRFESYVKVMENDLPASDEPEALRSDGHRVTVAFGVAAKDTPPDQPETYEYVRTFDSLQAYRPVRIVYRPRGKSVLDIRIRWSKMTCDGVDRWFPINLTAFGYTTTKDNERVVSKRHNLVVDPDLFFCGEKVLQQWVLRPDTRGQKLIRSGSSPRQAMSLSDIPSIVIGASTDQLRWSTATTHGVFAFALVIVVRFFPRCFRRGLACTGRQRSQET